MDIWLEQRNISIEEGHGLRRAFRVIAYREINGQSFERCLISREAERCTIWEEMSSGAVGACDYLHLPFPILFSCAAPTIRH